MIFTTHDQQMLDLTKASQFGTEAKGWSRLNEFSGITKTKNGFDSTVFKQGNNIVIAMPGTSWANAKDARNAIDIFRTEMPIQFNDAKLLYSEVSRKYPNSQIEFTGYSLGASNANLMSHYTGLKSTAFSPIGSEHIAQKYSDIYKFGDSNIRSYGVQGDKWFTSNLNRQSGQIFILPELKQRTNLFSIFQDSPGTYASLEFARLMKSGLGSSHMLYNYPDLSRAKQFNPSAQYINDKGQIQKMPRNWQNYINTPNPDFTKGQPAKLDEYKNPSVQGISGAMGDNVVDTMQIKYPAPIVNTGASKLGWLGQLGQVLSGLGNLVSLGVGIAGGLGAFEPGVPTGMSPTIPDPDAPTCKWTIRSASLKSNHTGGKISGRDDVLAILRGGETVRTEAQEQELQEQKHKEFLEAVRPYLEERENKPKTIAEAYDPNNKIPVLLNKTTQDEEFIISIIAQAWKSNLPLAA